MLSLDNSSALIESHDLIFDATDDLSVRYLIDDACAELDRPWVHAALYRGGSQLTLFWARFGSTFRKLYPQPSVAPSCVGAGMLGANASLVGNLQAIEAVRLITGQGRLKLGELVSINSDTMDVQSFKLPDVTHPEVLQDKQLDAFSERSLSASELRQALSIYEPLTLIDLRKDGSALGPDSIHQSEESILERGVSTDISGKAVLVCEEGMISSILATALSGSDKRIYYLHGGAKALADLG